MRRALGFILFAVLVLRGGNVLAAAPTVTVVSPASGSSLGGDTVTITGTGFAQGAKVDFGGAAGTNVNVADAQTITCNTPPHAPGLVTVIVTVSGASGTLNNAFTFTAASAPTITKISPQVGSTKGGTLVTITGTNFTNPARVSFGGTAAPVVTVNGQTEIVATTPAHAPGTFDVVLTNSDSQSVTLSAGFTFNPFRFLTTSLVSDKTNTFYSVQLLTANAAGDVTFGVVGTVLPPGLTLDPKTGVLSGRPTSANVGRNDVTFSANDGTTTIFLTTTIDVSLAAGGGPTFSVSVLPDGRIGVAYSATVSLTGGVGPIVFGAQGLPADLTINGATGVISGVPSVAGTFFAAITAVDVGNNNSKIFSVLPLKVFPAGASMLQFTTVLLSNGEVGTPYSFPVSVTGGTPPLSFSATGLPPGLTMNAGSGVISGTPAAGAAGTYLATITVTSGADTITLTRPIWIMGSATSAFYWNFVGALPAALVFADYTRTPPIFIDTRNPGPGPVAGLTYSATGLPDGIVYDPTTGALSGTPTETGVYPVVFTATDSAVPQQLTLSLQMVVLPPNGGDTNNLPTNLWVVKQSVKSGKGASWQALFIYNANRTPPKIFDSTKDPFSAVLGTPPAGSTIAITPPTQTFTGSKPKLSFKSPKGATPAFAVQLDENAQTIKLTAKGITAPPLPGVLPNTIVLGNKTFKLSEFFDSKGVFKAATGYRKAAFVAAALKLSAKTAKKDSAQLSLLLGDPALKFPADSGDKTVRLRVFKGATPIIDKTMTALISASSSVDKKSGQTIYKLKNTKDSSATDTLAKFTYDSASGKVQAAFKNMTLLNALPAASADGVQVGIELTLGEKAYFTGVTIFATKSGAYSLKLK